MTAAPTHTDDRRPRYRGFKSAAGVLMVFWHPCKTCGSIWRACFGYKFGVKAVNDGLGEWYCKSCKPKD